MLKLVLLLLVALPALVNGNKKSEPQDTVKDKVSAQLVKHLKGTMAIKGNTYTGKAEGKSEGVATEDDIDDLYNWNFITPWTEEWDGVDGLYIDATSLARASDTSFVFKQWSTSWPAWTAGGSVYLYVFSERYISGGSIYILMVISTDSAGQIDSENSYITVKRELAEYDANYGFLEEECTDHDYFDDMQLSGPAMELWIVLGGDITGAGACTDTWNRWQTLDLAEGERTLHDVFLYAYTSDEDFDDYISAMYKFQAGDEDDDNEDDYEHDHESHHETGDEDCYWDGDNEVYMCYTGAAGRAGAGVVLTVLTAAFLVM